MDDGEGRRRGRPVGGGGATRDAILRHATAAFVERGYAGTSMRAVASAAGVDPALVSYYFGSKRGLFAAATRLTIGPGDVLSGALEAAPHELPGRLVRAVVGAWEHPDHGPALVALAAASVSDPAARRAFGEYLDREVVTRLADHLGGPRATERAAAVAAVLGGAVMTRYVLRVPTTAALDPASFAASLVPAVAAVLAGRQRPVARGRSR